MKPKLPSINALAELVRHIKSRIEDDYRAFEDDDTPGIQLTVGYDPEDSSWSYQTGDNSFMGSAYGFPHWAVVGVYRRSNSREVARDIQDQIYELIEM